MAIILELKNLTVEYKSIKGSHTNKVTAVNNVSFKVDAKSVFDTIKVVLTKEGATAGDGGARGEFIGTATFEDLKTDNEGNYMKL